MSEFKRYVLMLAVLFVGLNAWAQSDTKAVAEPIATELD